MIRHITLLMILCLFISFANKQTTTTKIEFENNFTIINSDTLFLNKEIRGVNIKMLQRILKERPKKYDPHESSNIIYFYFPKQGIRCTSSNYGAKEYPLDIEIYYREPTDPTKKIKPFKGELILFGVLINESTTFNSLYNNPRIHNMIDYSYYGKDTNNLKSNSIIINTKSNSYSIHFVGSDGVSPIENITANF